MADTQVEVDNDSWSVKKKELLTEQPGLEVVPQELLKSKDHLAQARPPETAKYPVSPTVSTQDAKFKIESGPRTGDCSPEPVSTDFPEVADPRQVEAANQARHSSRQRRRRLIIIGSVVLVVICVGAVLGGVLGSRAASQRGSMGEKAATTTGPASPSSANKTALGYQAIMDRSSLAVTARRRRDGSTEGWLFYEDQGGEPQMLRWDTKRGGMLKATNEFTIKEPASYRTSRATGMAATTILQGPEDNPRILLLVSKIFDRGFQADSDPNLPGRGSVVFGYELDRDGNLGNTSRIGDHALIVNKQDSMEVRLSSASTVTAYWPWIIHGSGGPLASGPSEVDNPVVKVIEARNQMGDNFAQGPDWAFRNLSIGGKVNTKVSIVPLSADFKKSSDPNYDKEPRNGYGMFYHGPDDRLMFVHRSWGTERSPAFYLPQLPDKRLPTDDQLGRSAISAFAVAKRPPEKISTSTQQATFTLMIPTETVNLEVVVWAGTVATPEPTALVDAELPPNSVDVGVAYINQNRQFELLFMSTNTGYSNWYTIDTAEVNKLAPPDLFTDVACLTLASGAVAEDGGEWLLPRDQDEEGTIATCFYQSGSKVVKVRWIGEMWDTKWDVEWLPIPTGDSG
ncbi:hypothetical protein QC763_600460 [Podospora pseudopauciseta]|uniref:Fucose-specific lectin n=1 Tax=Podospora pseudopauciseta TaxID=2093780 RepID=A0ABR0H513_9PEZI|nr:hypothetical protein QC763_600460 [Podospora pseudopauciseta]